jgi:hypothetical protein
MPPRPPARTFWKMGSSELDSYDQHLRAELEAAMFDPSRRLSPVEIAAIFRHPDIVAQVGVLVGNAVLAIAPIIAKDAGRQGAKAGAQAALNQLGAQVATQVAAETARVVAPRVAGAAVGAATQQAYEAGRRDERKSAAFATTEIPADVVRDGHSVVVVRKPPAIAR